MKNKEENKQKIEQKSKENNFNKKFETKFRTHTLILIILILSFSIILSGCSGNNRPRVVNIYTGTEGLTVDFADNSPPLEIYEGSQSIIMAELWNKGAYSLIKGETQPIYVSVNVDEVYFSVGDGKTTFSKDRVVKLYLEGKSEVWPTGEKSIVPLGNLYVNEIPGTREMPTTKIDITACYAYKTYFSQNICVDRDIYNLEENPVCRNQKTYSYSGQGAPVIISQIDVDMIPISVNLEDYSEEEAPKLETNSLGEIIGIQQGATQSKDIIMQPHFRIYFKNTDKGVILSSDPKYDYSSNLAYNPCVKGPLVGGEAIKIKAKLGTVDLECSKAEIKMYSNEGSVRCWLPNEKLNNLDDAVVDIIKDENGQDDQSQFELNRNYELLLSVEAEYFYRTTTTKEVKIIRIS